MRTRLARLLLTALPLACADTPPTESASSTGDTGDTGTTTTTTTTTATSAPTTTDATGTQGQVSATGSSTGETSTSTTTSAGETSEGTSTTGTSGSSTGGSSTTGDPPPPPPDTKPDLVCPGDPGCEESPDMQLQAGAAVRSILPACFESWVDKNNNAVYDLINDTILDCGCDRLCPGDPGYKVKDAGEGDGKLQASWMAGFQNARAAKGVRGAGVGLIGEGDGLSARALVLEQGNTRLAIVALDLIGYFVDDVIAVREALAQKGADIDYLLIHAIHNHEGPDTMGLWGPLPGVSGYDPAYREQVRAAVVDAVLAADAAKAHVKEMVVGEVDVSTYHANGVANVIRDARDPWVVDEMLGAIRFVDDKDGTIATLVSFGSHPETVADKSHLFTADFVHGVRRTMELGSAWKKAPSKPGLGGPCLYINAAVGGMMTPLGAKVVTPDGDTFQSASFEKADAIGMLLGEMALDAVELGDHVVDPALDLQAFTFKAKIDNVNFNLMFQLGVFTREVFQEMDGNYLETEMALVNLGPVQLLSVPGELLPELAVGGYDGGHIHAPDVPLVKANNPNPPQVDQAPPGPYLKDRMHGTYRFIVGLGNDELGYIIPEYDFVLGDPPYVSEAEGDHYEETNSVGPAIASLVDAGADVLIAWSKWVHGL